MPLPDAPAPAANEQPDKPVVMPRPISLDERFNRWLDRRLANAIAVHTLLAVSGSWAAFWAYSQNHSYWKLIFGEHGPYAESVMIFIGSLVIFWQRHILFPATDPNDRNRFATTRCPRAFRLFWIFNTACLIYYSWRIYSGNPYRQPLPLAYYVFFFIPVGIIAAWSGEVVWSVFSSYTPTQLSRRIRHREQIEFLTKQLQRDTQDLVWSLGTITFFFLAYFRQFYLEVSLGLSVLNLVVALLFSMFPWMFAWRHVVEMMDGQLVAKEDELQRIYDADASEIPDAAKKAEKIQQDIRKLKSYQEQFDFGKWLVQRRKDIIPVYSLNVLAPYLAAPASQQLLHVFSSMGIPTH